MAELRTKIKQIRTGGQSGADRAAMDFSRAQGIPLCGWCPKNGWAEDYPDPPGLLTDYPELTETPSEGTAQRTKWNMRDCDAILTIIPNESAFSKGTEVGLEEGVRLSKPMRTVAGLADVPEIIRWLRALPDGTELCVGGPRASECAEAYAVTKAVLEGVAEGFDEKEPATVGGAEDSKGSARRGFVPEDEKNFSPDAVRKMQTASRHILYLIGEGYDLK